MNLKGFTLIELIIGIAVSSIISIILFNSFSQTYKTVNTIDNLIFMDRRISVLQNQLEKDITGIFMPEQLNHEKVERYFYSTNNQGQIKEFTFITTNALQVYQSTSPRIVRVTYQLRENKQNKGSYSLFRKESTNIIYGAEKDAVEYELTDFIKNLSIEFSYTEKPKDKDNKQRAETKVLKEWTPKEPDKKKGETYKIPEYVTVKVTLFDGALQKTEQSYEFKYFIYSPSELKQAQKDKVKNKQELEDEKLIKDLTKSIKDVLKLTQNK